MSYSSGTKIDVGDASVTFNWTKIDDFDFNLLSSEFVSSVQEVRVLSNGLENLSGNKSAQGGYDDVVQLSKLGSEGNVGYFIDVGFNEMFNLSSGVNSFEDLYDIEDYGNFVGSQGNDIILGGASHGWFVRWSWKRCFIWK